MKKQDLYSKKAGETFFNALSFAGRASSYQSDNGEDDNFGNQLQDQKHPEESGLSSSSVDDD